MIELEPVAYVHSDRTDPIDDDWDRVRARLELVPAFATEALDGVEAFSHVEVIYDFDRLGAAEIDRGARHTRGNPAWPRVGIFAQRAKMRPNRLGSTICALVRRDGRALEVAGLDAIDGTPVVDIKPVMAEFLPRGEVRQPTWSRELMTGYWKTDAR